MSDDQLKGSFASKLKGVFTFAQPMVSVKGDFNQVCKKELDAIHVHFANDNDIVPRLAPTYSHSGLMIRFKGDDVYITPSYLKEVDLGKFQKRKSSDNPSKLESVKNGITATFKKLKSEGKLTDSFEYGLPFKADHSIIEYVEKLQGVLDNPTLNAGLSAATEGADDG